MVNKKNERSSVGKDQPIEEFIENELKLIDQNHSEYLSDKPLFSVDTVSELVPVDNEGNGLTVRDNIEYFVKRVVPFSARKIDANYLLGHLNVLLLNEVREYESDLAKLKTEGSDEKPKTTGFKFVKDLFQSGGLNTLYEHAGGDDRIISSHIAEARHFYFECQELLDEGTDESLAKANEMKNDVATFLAIHADKDKFGTAGIDHLNKRIAEYSALDEGNRKSEENTKLLNRTVLTAGIVSLLAGAAAVGITYGVMNRNVNAVESRVGELEGQVDDQTNYQEEISNLTAANGDLTTEVTELRGANAGYKEELTSQKAELASQRFAERGLACETPEQLSVVMEDVARFYGGMDKTIFGRDTEDVGDLILAGYPATSEDRAKVSGLLLESGVYRREGETLTGWKAD
jgi:hypothetical protein